MSCECFRRKPFQTNHPVHQQPLQEDPQHHRWLDQEFAVGWLPCQCMLFDFISLPKPLTNYCHNCLGIWNIEYNSENWNFVLIYKLVTRVKIISLQICCRTVSAKLKLQSKLYISNTERRPKTKCQRKTFQRRELPQRASSQEPSIVSHLLSRNLELMLKCVKLKFMKA